MPDFYAGAAALQLPLKREGIVALTISGKLQFYLSCARPLLAILDGEGAQIVRRSGAGLAGAASGAKWMAPQVQ